MAGWQDQNGDGYLSFEELRQGLDEASAGSGECSSVAKAVMDALDVSGDGSIEYHEFLAAVGGPPAHADRPHPG